MRNGFIFFFFTFNFYFQVYNDADILEKIVKEKQKELGPLPEEDDVGSPKLKLRALCNWKKNILPKIGFKVVEFLIVNIYYYHLLLFQGGVGVLHLPKRPALRHLCSRNWANSMKLSAVSQTAVDVA